MPRYYFHLCNGNGFTEDREGTDLAGPSQAREHAIAGLRDVMASELRQGEINLGSFVEIEDGGHGLIATITFTEAVNIISQSVSEPRRQ